MITTRQIDDYLPDIAAAIAAAVYWGVLQHIEMSDRFVVVLTLCFGIATYQVARTYEAIHVIESMGDTKVVKLMQQYGRYDGVMRRFNASITRLASFAIIDLIALMYGMGDEFYSEFIMGVWFVGMVSTLTGCVQINGLYQRIKDYP